jgi:acetylornithine deacetylase
MSDKVHTWIEAHEEEMIEFLVEYISYRSPTEDEAEVQLEFVEPFFRNEMEWDDVTIVDVTDEQNRPNVNAVLAGDGDGDGKNILFNGHSDVVDVTAEDEAAWTKDPWDPSIPKRETVRPWSERYEGAEHRDDLGGQGYHGVRRGAER